MNAENRGINWKLLAEYNISRKYFVASVRVKGTHSDDERPQFESKNGWLFLSENVEFMQLQTNNNSNEDNHKKTQLKNIHYKEGEKKKKFNKGHQRSSYMLQKGQLLMKT